MHLRRIKHLLALLVGLTTLSTNVAFASQGTEPVVRSPEYWFAYASKLQIGSPVRVRTTDGQRETAVLAVNSATAGFHGFRHALSVASSHMVISEPVPEVIEEIGWTGGENIHDCRTLLHYLRTTKDGRIGMKR